MQTTACSNVRRRSKHWWYETSKQSEQSRPSTPFYALTSSSSQGSHLLDFRQPFTSWIEEPTSGVDLAETISPSDASSSDSVPQTLTLSPIKTTGTSDQDSPGNNDKSAADCGVADLREESAKKAEKFSTDIEIAVTLPALSSLDLSPVPVQKPVIPATTPPLNGPEIQTHPIQDGRSIKEIMDIMNLLTFQVVKKKVDDSSEKQSPEAQNQAAAVHIKPVHEKDPENIALPLPAPTVSGDADSTIQNLSDNFKKFLHDVASALTAKLTDEPSKTGRYQCDKCTKTTWRMCELRYKHNFLFFLPN